jgi:thioredoxin 1
VTVTEEEIAAFYEKIKDLVAAPLEEVRDQIRAELESEKRDAAIHECVRTLGKRMDIVVSDPWVREQAKRAADNPIARARASGKPTLVAFSSGTCCGPDLAAPLLDELREQHGDALNVVHMDARDEPLLMARHNVRSVPTFLLYDKNGQEIARRTGDLNPDEVTKLLGKATR